MEKLEQDKKKTSPVRGEEAAEGGSHASIPVAAQGKGKRQLGLASAAASRHERDRRVWASSFGSEEQHNPPAHIPHPRSAARGQRIEQAEPRGSGTGKQTKGEKSGRGFEKRGLCQPAENVSLGARSMDPAFSEGSPSSWTEYEAGAGDRDPSPAPGAVCPLPAYLPGQGGGRLGRSAPRLSPSLYICGPGGLETRPSSDRPGVLRGGFVAEVSLHIVGFFPPSFFLSFFFPPQ